MAKPFKQKTLFAAILQECEENLFYKNYSERMIDSRTENGFFVRQLKEFLEQSIIQNLWEYKLVEFQLSMTGQFTELKNGQKYKDQVTYEFSYVYDPAKIRLTLVSLKASMGEDLVKHYPIEGHPSQSLPRSADVYTDLFKMRDEQIKQEIKEKKIEERARRNARKH